MSRVVKFFRAARKALGAWAFALLVLVSLLGSACLAGCCGMGYTRLQAEEFIEVYRRSERTFDRIMMADEVQYGYLVVDGKRMRVCIATPELKKAAKTLGTEYREKRPK